MEEADPRAIKRLIWRRLTTGKVDDSPLGRRVEASIRRHEAGLGGEAKLISWVSALAPEATR